VVIGKILLTELDLVFDETTGRLRRHHPKYIIIDFE
jgi:hypothetical protein